MLLTCCQPSRSSTVSHAVLLKSQRPKKAYHASCCDSRSLLESLPIMANIWALRSIKAMPPFTVRKQMSSPEYSPVAKGLPVCSDEGVRCCSLAGWALVW